MRTILIQMHRNVVQGSHMSFATVTEHFHHFLLQGDGKYRFFFYSIYCSPPNYPREKIFLEKCDIKHLWTNICSNIPEVQRRFVKRISIDILQIV